MTAALLKSLALSLALTLILEAAFFLITGKRNKKDLLLLVLANVITNPAVVLIYCLSMWFTHLNLIALTAVLELAAVATEGFIYRRYGQDFKRPYLFSLAANGVSFGCGLLLQLLLGGLS